MSVWKCNNCGQYAEKSALNEFGTCTFCSPAKEHLTAKNDQYYMQEQARLRGIIDDASQPETQRKAAQVALSRIPGLYAKHRGTLVGTLVGTLRLDEEGEAVL